MTLLLQIGRCHGLSLAEEAIGDGGNYACAVNRGSEPADDRWSEPIARSPPTMGPLSCVGASANRFGRVLPTINPIFNMMLLLCPPNTTGFRSSDICV